MNPERLYTRRTILATGATGLAAGTLLARTPFASAATTPYTWTRPVVNGGMCNVIAADPHTAGVFYCGGDMYGMHRTSDAGATWTPMMTGASSIGDTYGRGVLASLTEPGTAYYAIATLRSSGGKFAACSGYNVSYRSSSAPVSVPLPSGSGGILPRGVGHILDAVLVGGVQTLWLAGSAVAKSTNNGASWQTVSGTSGVQYRSVVALSPTSALAARWNTPGLVLVQNGTASKPAAPGTIHELRTINTTVYGVGPGGVYTWNGSKLVPIASNSFFAGTVPVSIDGAGMRLVVGCTRPDGSTIPSAKCAAISNDGGASWTWLGGRQRQVLRTGQAYWLSSATNGFGGKDYSVSQVAVDKQNPNNVMFAGRSGVWGSTDGCLSVYPVGPGGAENTSVKAGPGPAEFACNDVDWKGIHTTDGWATMTKVAAPGGNTGLSATVGGVTYTVTAGRTPDVKRNGVSIATPYYKAAGCLAKCVGANSAGQVTVGLYGGGVLYGHP